MQNSKHCLALSQWLQLYKACSWPKIRQFPLFLHHHWHTARSTFVEILLKIKVLQKSCKKMFKTDILFRELAICFLPSVRKLADVLLRIFVALFLPFVGQASARLTFLKVYFFRKSKIGRFQSSKSKNKLRNFHRKLKLQYHRSLKIAPPLKLPSFQRPVLYI